MWEFLEQQLKTNQFLAGAIGGGIFWYILGFFNRIYAFLHRCYFRWCVYSLRINNDSTTYIPCLNYLYEKVAHKVKNVNLCKIETEVIKSPGYDWHFFFDGFNIVYFIVIEEKQEMGKERREYISIKVHGFNGKKIMNKLFDNIILEEKVLLEQQYIYNPGYYGDGWYRGKKIRDRNIDTIYIDINIKNSIIEKLDTFYKNSEKFNNMGICHKTGFVFYGEPGVGKSTLIQALASKYKRNICYLNLSNIKESQLNTLFTYLPEHSFLVFEDIDCHAKSVDREKEENNVATLLQCLDGISLPEGTVFFATTNKIENIDPAILRDGRFDYRIELLPANKEVAEEMILGINPDKIDILETLEFPVAQCKLQTLLLEE